MASSANPDPWSGLPGLNSADACAAIFKVNAEMFAAAPVRDADTIATFESLALGFLPKIDRKTLIEIARILAPCLDTPPSIFSYLYCHIPEARNILRQHRVL